MKAHKNLGKRAAKALITTCMACSMLAPASASAAGGLQDSDSNYDTQVYDSAEQTWSGGSYYSDGKIHLAYDTAGESSTWEEPGSNNTDSGDNISHASGTYTVTIPTLIKYTNMDVGQVNTSDSYKVNVSGAIGADKLVLLSASANNSGKLSCSAQDTDSSDNFEVSVEQGKTQWSASETFGSLNEDGSLSGTDCSDTITMSGLAKYAGTYEGSIQYVATLS